MPDTSQNTPEGKMPVEKSSATAPKANSVTPESQGQQTAFQDMTQWPMNKDQAKGLISTAFVDRVAKDLEFVKPIPGIKKPDPILVADKV
ncbi:MAG: ABC transporter ATP-binding protein, partial [Bifidobacterium aquikefiri]